MISIILALNSLGEAILDVYRHKESFKDGYLTLWLNHKRTTSLEICFGGILTGLLSAMYFESLCRIWVRPKRWRIFDAHKLKIFLYSCGFLKSPLTYSWFCQGVGKQEASSKMVMRINNHILLPSEGKGHELTSWILDFVNSDIFQ